MHNNFVKYKEVSPQSSFLKEDYMRDMEVLMCKNFANYQTIIFILKDYMSGNFANYHVISPDH